MKKRELVFFLVLSFTFFLFLNSSKANVSTTLNITPSNLTPPDLISSIPTQTWAVNTNLTNAFDLDNYFSDEENLTYNVSFAQNITININSSTHVVSFFSDKGFLGLRGVIFTAFDSFSNTNSNNVTLNVTNDTIPPAWSNPRKDKSVIYQNDIVKFFTDWQDNIALNSYIFSIKQESGWTDYPSLPFTGRQNTSNYTIQISAPGGTMVFWQFQTTDTTENLNSSKIQNFTVNSTSSPSSPPGGTGSTGSNGGEGSNGNLLNSIFSKEKSKGSSDFSTEPSSGFNIEIIQGGSGVITIKVTNTGNLNSTFEIDVSGLDEFKKTISDNLFNLTSGDSKSVTIEFNADKRLNPDIYYGAIKVKTQSGEKEISIVITIKAFELKYDLHVLVLKEYKSVKPASIVKANIKLENTKDIEERNITFYYAITDFKGNVIDSKTEDFPFSQRATAFERQLNIPGVIARGDYIFLARAVSGESIAIDSDIFEVGESFNAASFIRANFLILVLVLASISVALLMAKHHKNKEKLRLLNLYMMVNRLNKLIKEGKHDEAIDVYVKIKSAYGEPVSKTVLENKDNLIKEMKKLAESIDTKLLAQQPLQEKMEQQTTIINEKDKKQPINQEEENKREDKPIEKEQKDKTEKNIIINDSQDKIQQEIKTENQIEEKQSAENKNIKKIKKDKVSKNKKLKNKKVVKNKNDKKQNK